MLAYRRVFVTSKFDKKVTAWITWTVPFSLATNETYQHNVTLGSLIFPFGCKNEKIRISQKTDRVFNFAELFFCVLPKKRVGPTIASPKSYHNLTLFQGKPSDIFATGVQESLNPNAEKKNRETSSILGFLLSKSCSWSGKVSGKIGSLWYKLNKIESSFLWYALDFAPKDLTKSCFSSFWGWPKHILGNLRYWDCFKALHMVIC